MSDFRLWVGFCLDAVKWITGNRSQMRQSGNDLGRKGGRMKCIKGYIFREGRNKVKFPVYLRFSSD